MSVVEFELLAFGFRVHRAIDCTTLYMYLLYTPMQLKGQLRGRTMFFQIFPHFMSIMHIKQIHSVTTLTTSSNFEKFDVFLCQLKLRPRFK